MEPSDDDRLLSLAEAIADGRALPADTEGQEGPPDPVLRELQILSVLAEVHRGAGLRDGASSWADGAGLRQGTPPPHEWGPLEVFEEIGRGSFGAVYRARDLRLYRDVALKVYAPRHGLADNSIVAEGRLLARLNHPNVITVYGADVVDGTVGIWMELLRGRTLQQELDDRGPLGAREAALIGVDLCQAMAAVHQAGLVHRDIKAQNVMRVDGGRIVLMDFGAGHELAEPAAQIRMAGTPLYMAPDVLQGAPATPSSDLYSLGILLYHLVTNDFPVSAATLANLKAAHAAGNRQRLRDVRPDLPATFIRTVEDAIAPSPAERPPSAAALEAKLEAVLQSKGTGRRHEAGPRWKGLRWAALGSLIMVSIILGAFSGRIREYFAPPATGINSLAVLPFRNLTGQGDEEYLADSVTQLLIGNLSQLKSLRVISTTSAMSYKGRPKPLGDIARELNVDGLVEGSISRSNDRLRVTVQLLRADERSVWGQTYERPGSDVFKVTGEVSEMIADAVKLSLTPEERRNLKATPGVEVQAQEAFLRGLHRLSDFRPESLTLALVDLKDAVRLDPSSARAYATLSQCYRLLGAREVMDRGEAYRGALAAATRAVQLNDAVAEGHTELAEVKFYYEWNWEWARREYERALELSPNNSHALARYSQFLSALKRPDDALRLAKEAQLKDPMSLTVRFSPGMALYYAGRFDDAIAEFKRLAALPQYTLTPSDRVGLARAYSARRLHSEAIREMTLVLAPSERPLALWMAELGRIHAAAGHRAEARRILKELEPQRNRIPAHIAFILIALGSIDEGFVALDEAVEARAPALLWMNVDPRFDPVRNDSRLRDLALKIGVPQ